MAVDKANYRVEPMNVTFNSVDLGGTEGGIEISFTTETVDVKADQYGAHVLDQMLVGKGIEEITITLLETDHAHISALFGDGVGHEFTPAAGTEVYGFGTEKNFQLMSTDAAQLIFHPTRLAGADKSKDICFWKACPVPGSLSFSGEDLAKATMSFRIYPDLTKETEVNYFVVGDYSQDFTP